MKWATSVKTGKSSSKAVLLALAWEHKDHEPLIEAAVSKLAKATELGAKTIPPAVDRLVELGFVTRVRTHGSTNKYRLNIGHTTPENGGGSEAETTPQNGGSQNEVTTPKNGGTSPEDAPPPKTGVPPKTDHPPKGGRTTPQNGGGPPPKTGDSLSKEKNKTNNSSSNEGEKPAKFEADIYQKFAAEMWQRIQTVTASTKKPNLNSWARDIRLLVETDGRDIHDAWRVFAWAHADSFWRHNILSASKFRKQFDQLFAKSNGGKPYENSSPTHPTAAQRRALELRDATHSGEF